MVDKGPLLTSAIIFYLSVGASIFQVVEEPNWKLAVLKYATEKDRILQEYPCLTKDDLDKILEAVSNAAGQGVTITGNETFNNWNWPNAVIFSATIITTIGYGNIAPKTTPGRVFCVLYGLFGIPLCLTWISELGKFFGARAKRLGQFMIKRGLTLRKAQFTCTVIFLLWGVLVHLVIPPFVFMCQEGWTYIEGFYFSFVTLTTIGFGDLVAGVNPNVDYPVLYRYFVEIWIYLGLAWLSLFFNWKVRMVVEAHKALKKRRQRHRSGQPKSGGLSRPGREVDIFNFLSEKQEGYNDLIKQIGVKGKKVEGFERVRAETGRSRSCADAYDHDVAPRPHHSPQRKRCYSFSDRVTVAFSRRKGYLRGVETDAEFGPAPRENQLDKEPAGGTKDYQPLLSPSANITNIAYMEENLLSNDQAREDENTDSEGGRFSGSQSSVFVSDRSGWGLSCERLVDEGGEKGSSQC